MADINSGLVFLGETKLGGENEKLSELKKTADDFTSPLFQVNGLSIFVGICGDVTWQKPRKWLGQKSGHDQKADIFVHVTNGVTQNDFDPEPTGRKGYYVQADFEADTLCKFKFEDKELSLAKKAGCLVSDICTIQPFKKPKEKKENKREDKQKIKQSNDSPVLSASTHIFLPTPKRAVPLNKEKFKKKNNKTLKKH